MQGWNVGNGAVAGVAVQALGGAPAARHSGQCKPAASAATRPSIVLTTKRGAPDPEQTMSMAWGCNSGDATAANNAMANHAITHRRSVRVTSRICMVEIIDSINMNQFDLDHALAVSLPVQASLRALQLVVLSKRVLAYVLMPAVHCAAGPADGPHQRCSGMVQRLESVGF